jgi:hypothetical protein
MTPLSTDTDPALPHLPHEIVENIVRQTEDSSTLATFMQVSRRMYHVAAPRLYGEVVLTAKTAKGLYFGLSIVTDQKPSRPTEDIKGDVREKKRKLDMVSCGSDAVTSSSTNEHTSTSTPLATDGPPPNRKEKLLSMIRHLHVAEIPTWDTCIHLATLALKQGIPHPKHAMNVSVRPNAAWHMIGCYTHARAQHVKLLHPFLHYLRNIHVQHMCIQLPVMDRHVENSYITDSADTAVYTPCRDRDSRRAALCDSTSDEGIHGLFDLIVPTCKTLTIHNLVVAMSERALAFIDPNITTVRAFFRPCAGADGDLVDKTSSGYCYNHYKIGDSGFRLKEKILSRPQDMELIDIDWVRGNYNSGRDDQALESIRLQVDSQIEETPVQERVGWGAKRLKMSSEVEPCRCCMKSQLSAVEVSRPV